MRNKIKVAVQFFGFMRHYESTFNLWKNIIDYYNADVFIHTWDTEEYKNDSPVVDPFGSGQLPNPKQLNTQKLTSLYNPVSLVTESYNTFHNKFLEKTTWMEELKKVYLEKNPDHTWMNYSRFPSYASMYYKWMRVSQLKQRYELENDFVYDYVIHSRTDFAPTELFNLNAPINNLVTPPWPNSPHTQPWVNYDIGLNDLWVYGPSKAVDTYCSVYYNLEKVRDFCLSREDLGPTEAINSHVIPVINLAINGITEIQKHPNQHGNILR